MGNDPSSCETDISLVLRSIWQFLMLLSLSLSPLFCPSQVRIWFAAIAGAAAGGKETRWMENGATIRRVFFNDQILYFLFLFLTDFYLLIVASQITHNILLPGNLVSVLDPKRPLHSSHNKSMSLNTLCGDRLLFWRGVNTKLKSEECKEKFRVTICEDNWNCPPLQWITVFSFLTVICEFYNSITTQELILT